MLGQVDIRLRSRLVCSLLRAWIEKLFFEYNARLNVFKFLIKDNDIEQNILDKYQKEIENKYTELELAKKQVSE